MNMTTPRPRAARAGLAPSREPLSAPAWRSLVFPILVPVLGLVAVMPPARAQDEALEAVLERLERLEAEQEAQRAELAERDRQIEALKAELDALRSAQTLEAAAEAEREAAFAEVIVEGDAMEAPPAIAPVPEPAEDGEWSLNLYGHAMLDMGYQFNQNDPNWFDVLRPTRLPAFENQYGDDGSWFSSVRQSRFGVTSTVPTRAGDLYTLFEFELFGVGADEGQTTFRLRHAYGELGQFGAGQYWSGFMDIDVFPNSIEYWGPSGMIFYRNIQARWTPWRADDGSRFVITLEQPGGSGDEGVLADLIEAEGVRGDFELPDLAAHYRVAGDWGHLQAAAILREIRWVDTVDDAIDLSGDELGWGINLSTNVNLGRHVFRGSLTYGEGIQNYFNDSTADIGIALRPDRPELPIAGEAIPVLGLVAFLDLNWSDRWTSTIGYSLQDNDLPDLAADTSFERGQYALANLLYHPAPNMFFGPEIQWAQRDNYGPFSSDDFRVQFSAKYLFNFMFSGQ